MIFIFGFTELQRNRSIADQAKRVPIIAFNFIYQPSKSCDPVISKKAIEQPIKCYTSSSLSTIK